MTARDEYVKRRPAEPRHRRSARTTTSTTSPSSTSSTGSSTEARARFEPMWKEHCGKNEYGYKAWEKLITMSNLERDAERVASSSPRRRRRTRARSTPEQTGKAGSIINPTIQEAGFLRAREQFEKACEAKLGQKCMNPDAPEKRDTWRKAGELYESALAAAPGRDEAPEAAMNAAYAYKQIGEYNKAIALYNLFITRLRLRRAPQRAAEGRPEDEDRAGSEEVHGAHRVPRRGLLGARRDLLLVLQLPARRRDLRQDRVERAVPGAEAPREREERDDPLREHRSARQDDGGVPHPREDEPDGRRQGQRRLHGRELRLQAVEPDGGRHGARTARRASPREAALTSYYQTQRATPGAAKYVVEAAYAIAKMKKSGGDGGYRGWFKSTVAAWDNYRAKAPVKDNKSEAQKSPYVDYAAEAEFTRPRRGDHGELRRPREAQVRAQRERHLRRGADRPEDEEGGPRPGRQAHHEEEGQVPGERRRGREVGPRARRDDQEVRVARVGADGDRASGRDLRHAPQRPLQHGPRSRALHRAGAEASIKQMRDSGRAELEEIADKLEDGKTDFWRQKKQQELDGADQVMVKRYASAVAYARKYNIRNPQLSRAVEPARVLHGHHLRWRRQDGRVRHVDAGPDEQGSDEAHLLAATVRADAAGPRGAAASARERVAASRGSVRGSRHA